MENKRRNFINQISLVYTAKDLYAFFKKLIFIILICFVNCELKWDQIEELTEKITKYKRDLNEIRPVVFRLKRNLNIVKQKIKQERKKFEYFMITNKQQARVEKEILEKLEDIENNIVLNLNKVLDSTNKIKRKIETLCNAECKATTYHYFNGYIIRRGRPVLLKFKELNRQLFEDNPDSHQLNSVKFVDSFCTII